MDLTNRLIRPIPDRNDFLHIFASQKRSEVRSLSREQLRLTGRISNMHTDGTSISAEFISNRKYIRAAFSGQGLLEIIHGTYVDSLQK